MSRCVVCGNEYDQTFDVVSQGERYTFDSFECAIHKLAPTCDNCGIKIVGHGIDGKGTFYCCANCARSGGEKGAVDNIE